MLEGVVKKYVKYLQDPSKVDMLAEYDAQVAWGMNNDGGVNVEMKEKHQPHCLQRELLALRQQANFGVHFEGSAGHGMDISKRSKMEGLYWPDEIGDLQKVRIGRASKRVPGYISSVMSQTVEASL